jgi:hypothetical protein
MTRTGSDGESLALHWALSATDAGERRAVVSAAESLLAQAAWGAPDLPRADVERLELLGGAFDLAVRDRVEARLHAFDPAVREDLGAQVEWGAGQAFALYAVLPTPLELMPRLLRTLHLSALAVSGRRQADWLRWLAAHPIPARDDTAPWDVFLFRQLTELWCDLHQRSGPSELGRAMELLAELREERPARERALLATVPEADRTRVRFYLFALYHLVDAATELFLYLSHGRPVGVEHELARHFVLAREATTGDFRLEVLLVWLQVAAWQVASRRTPQLEIPGVRA